MKTPTETPDVIVLHGNIMLATERGNYPYDCISADEHPMAMVYHSDGGWTHEFASDFIDRDQSLDLFFVNNSTLKTL